jgi:hypothetical protein
VFAGHPGAGKTTLMSCTAAELDPALRVVVAEEVFEADISLPNVAHMQTRAARSDREPVDLRRWWRGSCAWRPTGPSSARSGTAKDSPNFSPTFDTARRDRDEGGSWPLSPRHRVAAMWDPMREHGRRCAGRAPLGDVQDGYGWGETGTRWNVSGQMSGSSPLRWSSVMPVVRN